MLVLDAKVEQIKVRASDGKVRIGGSAMDDLVGNGTAKAISLNGGFCFLL